MVKKDGIDIKLGISKKNDGQMLIRSGKAGEMNRENFFKSIDINPDSVVMAELSHGNEVKIIETKDEKIIPSLDGLITKQRDVCLAVTVADCLPIYFFNKEKGVIGIVHAGWRGILKGIVENMIEEFTDTFKVNPDDIKVKIGPHIRKCHFEVKEDVLGDFKNYKEFIEQRSEKYYIDLERIVIDKLKSKNINERNIELDFVCTYCDKDYFSFRRDKPKEVESQIAYIFR